MYSVYTVHGCRGVGIVVSGLPCTLFRVSLYIVSLSFRTLKKHANGEKDGGEEMNPTLFASVAVLLYSSFILDMTLFPTAVALISPPPFFSHSHMTLAFRN